ncbi:embryonic protein UVS.2-like [Asterias amurensis]|uniref:embryonic protein UVS.2-like n=1 Tax=Asterias amurensis TaxID=7602 RepID=UPI003AB3E3BE
MACAAVALTVVLVAFAVTCQSVHGDELATRSINGPEKQRTTQMTEDEALKHLKEVVEKGKSRPFIVREQDEDLREVARAVCGGSLSGSGTLTSPAYPGDYPPDADCLWTITAPAGQHVELSIDTLDIEDGSTCEWDRLSIKVANEYVPAGMCGSGSVVGSFVSSGNQMTVWLQSDESIQTSGFSASYSSVYLQ